MGKTTFREITPYFSFSFDATGTKEIKTFNKTKLLDFLVLFSYNIKSAKKSYGCGYYPILKKTLQLGLIKKENKDFLITEKGKKAIYAYVFLQKILSGYYDNNPYDYEIVIKDNNSKKE